MKMHGIILAGLAAFMASAPVAVSAVEDSAGNGRYVMSPTSDGFLKLDSRTGEVSECKRQATGFQCTLVADERTALQQEIDRLSRDNTTLREALAKKGVTPPAVAPPAGPNAAAPSDREFDRAMDLMERFIRRFMSIVKEDPKPSNPL